MDVCRRRYAAKHKRSIRVPFGCLVMWFCIQLNSHAFGNFPCASLTWQTYTTQPIVIINFYNIGIDTKSHAFAVRLTLFDPISRNHAIQTKYHSFFLNTTTRGKFLIEIETNANRPYAHCHSWISSIPLRTQIFRSMVVGDLGSMVIKLL